MRACIRTLRQTIAPAEQNALALPGPKKASATLTGKLIPPLCAYAHTITVLDQVRQAILMWLEDASIPDAARRLCSDGPRQGSLSAKFIWCF